MAGGGGLNWLSIGVALGVFDSNRWRVSTSTPTTPFGVVSDSRVIRLDYYVMVTVRTRMWTLVGARIVRFWIARLGSVHLPVGTRDGHA
ncbi:hypothetical protein CRG98_014390 [Punica granatum]|uniref:Uncharacterized protein n=1 Tax=Punica granatum TaxID=22663 RepID=A0A2I0K9N0_PUNGR|nr:hypothetical protein CRG98_014390 [Punica granatum]